MPGVEAALPQACGCGVAVTVSTTQGSGIGAVFDFTDPAALLLNNTSHRLGSVKENGNIIFVPQKILLVHFINT
jgi:hypothetical protein